MPSALSAGPKKKAEIKEVTFSVHLHCQNCVNKVQENIAFEKGVKDLKVSLDHQTVFVKYDAAKTSEATLKAQMNILESVFILMSVVMAMSVLVTMVVTAVLMTRSHYTCYRIAKLLDSCLECSL